MRLFKTRLLACAAASLLLAGCWDEEDTAAEESKVTITSVKVFGDSLADVGTFGLKFTVQSTSSASPSLIYPERVAQAYGISSMCPVYLYTGSSFTANTTAGCTNHAIGGGRINNPSDTTGLSPQSIRVQLANAGAAGSYSATDLLLIDGGGNDAADLVGAYLTASGDAAAKYLGLVGTLVDAGTISTVMAGSNGLENLGGLYLQALATAFYNSIKANALDKGAQHVAVINLPGITKTPRFQAALDSVAAAYGGGATGAAARANAETLFQTWIQAFNSTLATKVSGDSSSSSKVMLVDGYTLLEDMVANPSKAAYGLTNATTPTCTGTTTGGDTDWTTCVDALLSTTPPTGVTDPNWWKSYLFSDSFHPTPYGHELFYNSIRAALVAGKRL